LPLKAKVNQAMAELLLELFSEEIPARMQSRAAEELERLIGEGLQANGLSFSRLRSFATPRRLTVVVDGLPMAQPDLKEEKKGPREGAPQQAVDGFLKSAGLASLDQCERRDTGKGVFYFATIEKKGQPTAAVLPQIVLEAICKLGWPKSMRWAGLAFNWVRPLHHILAVFDGQALRGSLPLALAGEAHLALTDKTSGHRFMAPAIFPVRDFGDYAQKLRAARVMLDPEERRATIRAAAEKLAEQAGLRLKADEGLLEEVAGLVEWPVPLMGSFDPAFMSLPPEVLTTTMRANQKYFALLDKGGQLAPHFIVVANIAATDGGKAIIAGNERVLRARLSDARFFWEQDLKIKLRDRLPALKDVIFHAKLGTLAEKAARVTKLAKEIAPHVKADAAMVEEAASLAKADLVSGMVGEFPELQGTMGRYYAKAEGLPDAVADAIADHYKPLGPGDDCPKAPVSVAVALADKLDTLAGFFAIDEKPTGSKDPFALRRAALGVIRLILENGLRLDLQKLLSKGLEKEHIDSLMAFFADRLKVVLKESNVRHDLVNAGFAVATDGDFKLLLDRIEALADFLRTDDGKNLLVAYRRAANILRIEEKKDGKRYQGMADPAAFVLLEEKILAAAIETAQKMVTSALGRDDFTAAMVAIAALRGPVDAFFDKVTVNADDARLRENRLRLLAAITASLSAVADFSKIED